MPYIMPKDREQLDPIIQELSKIIKNIAKEYNYDGAFAGILNYTCTTLVLQVLPARRYWVIALVTGVLENIKQEFYRRYAAPYEDEQIIKNGDCY